MVSVDAALHSACTCQVHQVGVARHTCAAAAVSNKQAQSKLADLVRLNSKNYAIITPSEDCESDRS